jgi:enediyne biosynthesis protein E4
MNASPDPVEPPDQDPAVLNRGLKISTIVLMFLVLAGGGLRVYLVLRKPPVRQQVTQLATPESVVRPGVALPQVPFVDITRESGITFQHETGAYGEKLLPETMGGGVAWVDYDGNGIPDLLFVNSSFWPWKAPGGRSQPPSGIALYHNDGTGRFTDVTAGSGLQEPFYGMGVAVGDYDNDGRTDILITGVGGARLFHNEGDGKFRNATAFAQVGGAAEDWSTAATFFDYDNDGLLDLYVANYVRWSREIDARVGYKIDGNTRAYGPPMNFEGAFPHLYHNEGNGRFREVSDTAGIRIKNPATGVPVAKTLGLAPIDLNGDGFLDLVVANDTVQNLVFTNRHDGTFGETGAASGLAFDGNGNARGAMGIDAARFTGDGRRAVVIGNFANEMTAFYMEGARPLEFTDDSIAWGVGPVSRLPLKFGVFFFDYDLDGRLDLLSCNGHLEEEISRVQSSQSYRQSAQLFWNAGESSLLPAGTNQCGADLFRPIVGRGCAYADIDGDGDLDVVLTQVGGPPVLLRNNQSLGHHYVQLRLRGTVSNRDAIGATVALTAGGSTQWRQVMPTKSYLSASELVVTFGLGTATAVDKVEILWPKGGRQMLEGLKVDSLMTVEEPK